MNRFIVTSIGAALAVAISAGCDEPKPANTPPAQPGGGGAAATGEPKADEHGHEHAHGEKHADGDEHAEGEDHSNRIELGTQTVAGLTLKATQEEPIKPGGEGAFDLAITGGKPRAVRFWVGTEDGLDSVKAKAEEETPNNWHAHVEVPDPLPAGSKFCAEVEPASGERFTVSFELK